MNTTCPSCGEEKVDSNFCPRCGKELNQGITKRLIGLSILGILLIVAGMYPRPSIESEFLDTAVMCFRAIVGLSGAILLITSIQTLRTGNPIPHLRRAKDISGIIDFIDHHKGGELPAIASRTLIEICKDDDDIEILTRNLSKPIDSDAKKAIVATLKGLNFKDIKSHIPRRCAKCFRTEQRILSDFDDFRSRGGVVIGSGSGLLYCDNCSEYFCGKCQVDLGLDSGCPICKSVLS
jgi:hypothetical protein